MRSFLSTLHYNTLLIWRDKTTVIMLIVFPIILILILGNALSSVMGSSPKIDPIACALSVEDEGLAAFMQSEDIADLVLITQLSPDEAKSGVDAGEYACAVTESGGKVRLYYTDPERQSSARIVYSMLDSYLGISGAVEIRMENGDYQVLQNLDFDTALLERKPLSNTVPSAIDYYAVAMTIMFLIYSGMTMVDVLEQNVFSAKGQRIRTSPVGKLPFLTGLMVSSMLTGVVQAAVLVMFSKFAYGANWGGNPLIIAGALLGMCMLSQAIAIFFLTLTKSAKAASGMISLLAFLFTFVSKGFTTQVRFPEAVERVFEYAPNALTQRLIFGTIYGTEVNAAANLGILFSASGVLLIASVFLLRRAYK